MEAPKGFKNNSGIFNEEILYYHSQVPMVGDNILSQGKTLQVPNPKAGLPLSSIKYDLNHVSDLETEKISKTFPSSKSVKKILKEEFSEQTRRYIILSQRGKIYR